MEVGFNFSGRGTVYLEVLYWSGSRGPLRLRCHLRKNTESGSASGRKIDSCSLLPLWEGHASSGVMCGRCGTQRNGKRNRANRRSTGRGRSFSYNSLFAAFLYHCLLAKPNRAAGKGERSISEEQTQHHKTGYRRADLKQENNRF